MTEKVNKKMENYLIHFQKDLEILYPNITLIGNKELIQINWPFFGFEDIQFQLGGVMINTINFEGKERVSVTIFKGMPKDKEVYSDIICASGNLEVGKEGISLSAGGTRKAVFQWPAGKTNVLVILKASEALTKQIRNITIFLTQYKPVSQRNLFDIIFRRST
jgi:hypothetical protein